MKYLFFFFPLFTYAQEVKWESSLAEGFRRAGKENKILFVEFYAPGCPYCQRIAPFFKEKTVAELYNSAFVNYQLNADTPEAADFVKATGLEVYGIPYFLFFRADSSLVHAREVSAELNSVLQPGKMVIEKTYTGENYARRFEGGERSENFLTHYAIFARVKKDTLTNRKVIQALWEMYPPEKRSSRTSWAILKKALLDTQNGFTDYWLQNIARASTFESASSHGSVENAFSRLLYGTLFSREAEAFTAARWRALRENFTPVLKEAPALIWEKEVLAAFREGNTAEALSAAEEAAKYFRDDAAGLSYLAQVMDKNCRDNDCRRAVDGWRQSARRLQEKEIKK